MTQILAKQFEIGKLMEFIIESLEEQCGVQANLSYLTSTQSYPQLCQQIKEQPENDQILQNNNEIINIQETGQSTSQTLVNNPLNQNSKLKDNSMLNENEERNPYISEDLVQLRIVDLISFLNRGSKILLQSNEQPNQRPILCEYDSQEYNSKQSQSSKPQNTLDQSIISNSENFNGGSKEAIDSQLRIQNNIINQEITQNSEQKEPQKLVQEPMQLGFDSEFVDLDFNHTVLDEKAHGDDYALLYVKMIGQKLPQQIKDLQKRDLYSGFIIYASSLNMKLQIIMNFMDSQGFINDQSEIIDGVQMKLLIVTSDKANATYIFENMRKHFQDKIEIYAPQPKIKLKLELWNQIYKYNDLFIIPLDLLLDLLIGGYLHFKNFNYVIFENTIKDTTHLNQIMQYYGYQAWKLKMNKSNEKLGKIIGFITTTNKSEDKQIDNLQNSESTIVQVCKQFDSKYLALDENEILQIQQSLIKFQKNNHLDGVSCDQLQNNNIDQNVKFMTLKDQINIQNKENIFDKYISFNEQWSLSKTIKYQEEHQANFNSYCSPTHINEEVTTCLDTKHFEASKIQMSACIPNQQVPNSDENWSKLRNQDQTLRYETKAGALCFLLSAKQVFKNFYRRLQDLLGKKKIDASLLAPKDFKADFTIESQLLEYEQFRVQGKANVTYTASAAAESPRYQAKLYLPVELIPFFYESLGVISQPGLFKNKKDAKHYQYLELVKILHKKGLINDQLTQNLQYYQEISRTFYEQHQSAIQESTSEYSQNVIEPYIPLRGRFQKALGEEVDKLYFVVFINNDPDLYIQKNQMLIEQNSDFGHQESKENQPENDSDHNCQLINKLINNNIRTTNFPFQNTNSYLALLFNQSNEDTQSILPYYIDKREQEEIEIYHEVQVNAGKRKKEEEPDCTIESQLQTTNIVYSEVTKSLNNKLETITLNQRIRFNYTYSLYSINNGSMKFIKGVLFQKFTFGEKIFKNIRRFLQRLFKYKKQPNALRILFEVFKLKKMPFSTISYDEICQAHPYLVPVKSILNQNQDQKQKFELDYKLIVDSKRQVESDIVSLLFSPDDQSTCIDRYHLETADSYYNIKRSCDKMKLQNNHNNSEQIERQLDQIIEKNQDIYKYSNFVRKIKQTQSNLIMIEKIGKDIRYGHILITDRNTIKQAIIQLHNNPLPSSAKEYHQEEILLDRSFDTNDYINLTKGETVVDRLSREYQELFQSNSKTNTYKCLILQQFIDGEKGDDVPCNYEQQYAYINTDNIQGSPFLYEQFKVQQLSLLRFINFKQTSLIRAGIEHILKDIPLIYQVPNHYIDMFSWNNHPTRFKMFQDLYSSQQKPITYNKSPHKLSDFYKKHSYLFEEALITPSANQTVNYERLAFYGDACISFLVILELFSQSRMHNESELDFYRIKSISNTNMSNLNRQSEIYKYMISNKYQLSLKSIIAPGIEEQEYNRQIRNKHINSIDSYKFYLKQISTKLLIQEEKRQKTIKAYNEIKEPTYCVKNLKNLEQFVTQILTQNYNFYKSRLVEKYPSILQIIKQETKMNYQLKIIGSKYINQSRRCEIKRNVSREQIEKICHRMKYELNLDFNKIKRFLIQEQLGVLKTQRNQLKKAYNEQLQSIQQQITSHTSNSSSHKSQYADAVASIAGCLALNSSLHSTYEFLVKCKLFDTSYETMNNHIDYQLNGMKNERLEKQYAQNIAMVQNQIKYEFRNKSLILNALTHKSFMEQKSYHPSSQQKEHKHQDRLTYLGHYLINLMTTDKIFHQTKRQPEVYGPNQLFIRRLSLCNDLVISVVAAFNDIDQYILIGQGRDNEQLQSDIVRFKIEAMDSLTMIQQLYTDQNSNQSQNTRPIINLTSLLEISHITILGDTLKAIIAAVFLDSKSLQTTKDIYHDIFESFLSDGLIDEEVLKFFQEKEQSELLQLWNSKYYTKNLKLYHKVEYRNPYVYFKGYIQNTEMRRIKFDRAHIGKLRKFYKEFRTFIQHFFEEYEKTNQVRDWHEVTFLTQLKNFRNGYDPSRNQGQR